MEASTLLEKHHGWWKKVRLAWHDHSARGRSGDGSVAGDRQKGQGDHSARGRSGDGKQGEGAEEAELKASWAMNAVNEGQWPEGQAENLRKSACRCKTL